MLLNFFDELRRRVPLASDPNRGQMVGKRNLGLDLR